MNFEEFKDKIAGEHPVGILSKGIQVSGSIM